MCVCVKIGGPLGVPSAKLKSVPSTNIPKRNHEALAPAMLLTEQAYITTLVRGLSEEMTPRGILPEVEGCRNFLNRHQPHEQHDSIESPHSCGLTGRLGWLPSSFEGKAEECYRFCQETGVRHQGVAFRRMPTRFKGRAEKGPWNPMCADQG